MDNPFFYIGQAIGSFLFFALLYGIFALIRWAFRKVFPPKPRRPSGPLSGAGR